MKPLSDRTRNHLIWLPRPHASLPSQGRQRNVTPRIDSSSKICRTWTSQLPTFIRNRTQLVVPHLLDQQVAHEQIPAQHMLRCMGAIEFVHTLAKESSKVSLDV